MRSILHFLLFCGVAWGQSTADGLYTDAMAAQQKGDYAKAEFLLRDMRLEAPKDERWLAGLLGVLLQQNKSQDAIEIAREAEPEFAKSQTIHLLVGLMWQHLGRADEALQEFENVLQLSETNAAKATAYGTIGQAHWYFGELDAAITAYRRAKELSGPPNVVFAESLLGKGERDEAIAEFRAVLRANPNSDVALTDLASTWASRGENLDEALQFANRASALRPSFALVTETLGWVLFKKGMVEEAEDTIIRSLGQEGGAGLTQREHLAAVMDARNQWTPERRELRKLLEGELSAGQLARMKELVSK